MNKELVIVKWEDSGLGDGGWSQASEYVNKPMTRCVSVGWIYHEDEEKVILFSAFCLDNESYVDGNEGSLQLISRKCIETITVLEH